MPALFPQRLRRLAAASCFSISPRLAAWLGLRFSLDSADRRFLEGPVFGFYNACYAARRPRARCLFIGLDRYNWHYHRLLQLDFHTLDIDPGRRRYGQPGRHRVGDATALRDLYASGVFDLVIANGLVGYGINDAESFEKLLAGVVHVLRPGGRFLLGYNARPDRASYPVAALLARSALLPEHAPIEGMLGGGWLADDASRHCYALCRKPHASAGRPQGAQAV
ncbi:class I SAM-dependent methyltransferase [Bordetella trematum]|uniref:class I SAM-dependent methyltransferase n=1 Tax=Bordetella trematum TaxID=123899 RepID=UPI003989148C